MSDLYMYNPAFCDGDFCPMDCSHCYKADQILAAEDEEAKDAEED